MRRLWSLLLTATWRQILQWLAWRSFLLTLAINQAVAPLLGLTIWSVALPGSSAIPTYYIALLICQLLTVSYEQHTFSNGVYAGELTHDLLRPQPVVLGPLGANLALRLWHLVVGVPLILLLELLTHARFDPLAVLLALPALLMAAVLRFLFSYLLSLSAFWTEQAHGVAGFGETLLFLLGGSAIPIPLFPIGLRPLGEALPFRAMLGFPAEIVSGQLAPRTLLLGYGWQLLWILVFLPLAILVWRAGVRRYSAIGG
ncbi:ABC-2 family transporter protein [Dictyobacter aurantiacus]|uniref:ABC transporter permease n=1 Tax=Dictyobacter aurantiacus TaxID=1936993 RepID=A0A401ZJN6_9CHLR|nr:ABC-2 family transporter protein [Dictyobacter aurantiacus]GCE07077.1 ABC transporter permease [Dictyobacter aurantiacus]